MWDESLIGVIDFTLFIYLKFKCFFRKLRILIKLMEKIKCIIEIDKRGTFIYLIKCVYIFMILLIYVGKSY